MKMIFIALIILAIIASGCTSLSLTPASSPKVTAAPVAQSEVKVIPATVSSTPLEAPTIEKITRSYLQTLDSSAPDAIVGMWTVTNASVSPSIVFRSGGTGYASALWQEQDFSWNNTNTTDDLGQTLYTISFDRNGNTNEETITYNSSTDSATSSMTAADQYMIRKD